MLVHSRELFSLHSRPPGQNSFLGSEVRRGSLKGRNNSSSLHTDNLHSSSIVILLNFVITVTFYYVYKLKIRGHLIVFFLSHDNAISGTVREYQRFFLRLA